MLMRFSRFTVRSAEDDFTVGVINVLKILVSGDRLAHEVGAAKIPAGAMWSMNSFAARGLFPTSVEIWSRREMISPRFCGRIRLDAFRRARIGESTVHPAIGATLRFDQPATGPIVLGLLAHFGPGRFEPVTNVE